MPSQNGPFEIDGVTDEVQSKVVGNNPQTQNLQEWVEHGGLVHAAMTPEGTVVLGTLPLGAFPDNDLTHYGVRLAPVEPSVFKAIQDTVVGLIVKGGVPTN